MGLSIKASIKPERCTFDALKAFDDNVSIKSTLSYSVTTSFLGRLADSDWIDHTPVEERQTLHVDNQSEFVSETLVAVTCRYSSAASL